MKAAIAVVAGGAEDGEFPACRADCGRAAFVALAGTHEAPFLAKKSARKVKLALWSHRAVAVLAGMTAPKGTAEARTTRRRASAKVYSVFCAAKAAPQQNVL